MDEGEFLRLLESYPVVRKKTHCRVQWNDMYDDEPAVQTASSGIFIPAGKESAIQPTDSAEDALEKFLTPYFSSQEAAKIQRQLEKAQLDFVSSLNLEDVNDLCAQFVATK
ncbi:D-2-hydroxyglutarate dehydrogenase, mitochondrial precursor [Phytophthora cinnamomi]|uniref:D-2-hydroxyglutarate dehydrogenase, mitochondrial precursor n=1 Tax=Phytophthora cinnamomi TaxID=4785 RepID=UPI0035599328|nr:D-2-hydroxyglutarate dehydrogenase, mitochondrial precursor [Phytophthora cinnamomi]